MAQQTRHIWMHGQQHHRQCVSLIHPSRLPDLDVWLARFNNANDHTPYHSHPAHVVTTGQCALEQPVVQNNRKLSCSFRIAHHVFTVLLHLPDTPPPPHTPPALSTLPHPSILWDWILILLQIKFERFYAGSPICSPTRASFLTGRTPWRDCIFNVESVFTPCPPNHSVCESSLMYC
jgi:hypothetical protein